MEGETGLGRPTLNFLLVSRPREDGRAVSLAVLTVEFDALPMDPLVDVVKECKVAEFRQEPLEHWIDRRRRNVPTGAPVEQVQLDATT